MNANEETNTEIEDILGARSTEIVVFESILMLVINAVAFLGNFLICWTIYRNNRLHTVTNIYILALAISDMLMACVVMPFSSGTIITGKWLYGGVICDVQGFTVLVLSWVALQTIALTAINRFFRVVKPVFYRNWFTPDRSVAMVITAWFLVLLLVALPPLADLAHFSFKAERAICFISFHSQYQAANIAFTTLHLTLFVILPFLIIIICYGNVYRPVKRHTNSISPLLHPGCPRFSLTVEEIKISRILLSITIGYLIIWIPVVVIETMHTLYGRDLFPRGLYLVYTYLWYGSSIVNPLVYGYMNRTFRAEARQVFPTSRRMTEGSRHCSVLSPVALQLETFRC